MFSVDLLARPEHLLALGVAIAVVVYAFSGDTAAGNGPCWREYGTGASVCGAHFGSSLHPWRSKAAFLPGPHWFLGIGSGGIAFSGYRFRGVRCRVHRDPFVLASSAAALCCSLQSRFQEGCVCRVTLQRPGRRGDASAWGPECSMRGVEGLQGNLACPAELVVTPSLEGRVSHSLSVGAPNSPVDGWWHRLPFYWPGRARCCSRSSTNGIRWVRRSILKRPQLDDRSRVPPDAIDPAWVFPCPLHRVQRPLGLSSTLDSRFASRTSPQTLSRSLRVWAWEQGHWLFQELMLHSWVCVGGRLTLGGSTLLVGRWPQVFDRIERGLDWSAERAESGPVTVSILAILAICIGGVMGHSLTPALAKHISQKHVVDAHANASARAKGPLFRHGSFGIGAFDFNFYTQSVPEVKDVRQTMNLLSGRSDGVIRMRSEGTESWTVVPVWDPKNDVDGDGKRDWAGWSGLAVSAEGGVVEVLAADWKADQWKEASSLMLGRKFDVVSNTTNRVTVDGKPHVPTTLGAKSRVSIDHKDTPNARATALNPHVPSSFSSASHSVG